MQPVAMLLVCLAAAPAQDRPGFGALAVNLSAAKEAFAKAKSRPPVGSGVVVLEVTPGSPAESARLKPLDIITKIGETNVRNFEDYQAAVAGLKIGEQARVWYRRHVPAGSRLKWDAQQTTVTPISAADLAHLRKTACPLELMGGSIRTNVINLPDARIQLRNRTSQRILAYSVEMECFNSYGEPVRDFAGGSNVFRGVSQDVVEPYGEDTATWQLSLHATTSSARVRIMRVKLEDGTEWRPEKGKEPSLSVKLN